MGRTLQSLQNMLNVASTCWPNISGIDMSDDDYAPPRACQSCLGMQQHMRARCWMRFTNDHHNLWGLCPIASCSHIRSGRARQHERPRWVLLLVTFRSNECFSIWYYLVLIFCVTLRWNFEILLNKGSYSVFCCSGISLYSSSSTPFHWVFSDACSLIIIGIGWLSSMLCSHVLVWFVERCEYLIMIYRTDVLCLRILNASRCKFLSPDVEHWLLVVGFAVVLKNFKSDVC